MMDLTPVIFVAASMHLVLSNRKLFSFGLCFVLALGVLAFFLTNDGAVQPVNIVWLTWQREQDVARVLIRLTQERHISICRGVIESPSALLRNTLLECE